MNAFVIASFVLVLGFVPIVAVCLAGRELDGVAAVALAGALATLVFLCLAEGLHLSSSFDVPVICAVVTWIGSLVLARFFARLGR